MKRVKYYIILLMPVWQIIAVVAWGFAVYFYVKYIGISGEKLIQRLSE